MWHPESIFDASGHLDEGVVHAWLDDQLAPDTATQVAQHAAGCATCAAMVAEARGLLAGSSRVLASLDEPAAGRVPARDAMLGIVTAAGRDSVAGTATPPATGRAAAATPGHHRDIRRWSTRRVSLLAAAALVLVTGTLVLRDSGTVQEMVEADQGALDSVAVARPVAPGASLAMPEAAPEGTAGNAAAGGGEAGGARTGERPGQMATAVGAAGAESRANQQPQRFVDRPEPRAAAKSSAGVGSVGSTSGAGRAAENEPGAGFRSSVPAVTQRSASPPLPPTTAASSPPAPAPAPAVAQGVAGGRADVPRAGEVRERAAGDEAARVREIAVARDAASRGVRSSATDERRQLPASESRSAQELIAEPRPGVVRTSAEIQAMVRMVSSCWRVADTDSVVELQPPGTRDAGSGAPEGSQLWIRGWLRIGRDATNPARIWWLPLGDSVSARVRLDDAASPDLVITPSRDAALVRRIPRTDSLATWGATPRGDAAQSAASVRCPSP